MKLQKLSTWVKASEGPLPKGKEGDRLCIKYGDRAGFLYFTGGKWFLYGERALTDNDLFYTEWEYEQEAYILTKEEYEAMQADSFQNEVYRWLLECFGPAISNDKVERCHRFMEETLELVQSLGIDKSEVTQLVDYVFNRPIGEPHQELGGVMVTLAALCPAHGLNMTNGGRDELNRIWHKVEKIREKQRNKPKVGPLPQ